MSNKFKTIEPGYHCTTYNVGGFPIKVKPGFENSRILEQENPVPAHWVNQPKISSLSALRKTRADSKKFDLSYDLDGDGTVGNREYKIARHFDRNKDGVLDSSEKKRCIEAIKQRFEFPKITE